MLPACVSMAVAESQLEINTSHADHVGTSALLHPLSKLRICCQFLYFVHCPSTGLHLVASADSSQAITHDRTFKLALVANHLDETDVLDPSACEQYASCLILCIFCRGGL